MASAATDHGEMAISIQGLRSGKGKLAISIFANENKTGFPGDGQKAIQTFYVDLNGARNAELKSKPLPFGVYAVSMMHDENGDGKFATLLGIPKDGFGFSRNPKIFFGPPGFDSCAFTLSESNIEVPITVKYIL